MNIFFSEADDDLMLVDGPDVPEVAPPSSKKRKLSDDDSAPRIKKTKVSESGDSHVVAEDDDLVVLWNTRHACYLLLPFILYTSTPKCDCELTKTRV